MTTARAPSARRAAAFASVRVVPVTAWPCSRSRGTRVWPTVPPAPAMKMCMALGRGSVAGCDRRGRPAPPPLLDRLPHARQRGRSRGRGAGGLPAPRAQKQGAGRARVHDRGHHAARHRRAALGARAPRGLSGELAARAARGRRGAGPRGSGGDGVARLPRAAGAPVARRAGGARPARGVRPRLRRDRGDRRPQRGQLPPDPQPGAPPDRRTAGRASTPIPPRATRSPRASSPRRGTATWKAWSRCSPRTPCSWATAAAGRGRSRARCTAREPSPARW